MDDISAIKLAVVVYQVALPKVSQNHFTCNKYWTKNRNKNGFSRELPALIHKHIKQHETLFLSSFEITFSCCFVILSSVNIYSISRDEDFYWKVFRNCKETFHNARKPSIHWHLMKQNPSQIDSFSIADYSSMMMDQTQSTICWYSQ